MDTFGYRTLGEALQSVNGLYTSTQRDYSYVGIRGFSRTSDYNTRLLLLNDGVKLNDPVYNSAYIGNESQLDIDWLKRIEYISGSGSFQYG
jgi:iron complex outermembrane receptor protein